MTAIDVEVQVGTAPLVDVEVQFGDAPTVDVAVQVEPPTLLVMSVLPTGPRGPAGVQGADGDMGPQGDPGQDGADGADGAPGVVQSIVEGTNITVDDTDPANPIVASTGGSGLPDPWTADQTSGEVTARTDGSDLTALTVEAVAAQTEPLQVWRDEDGNLVARLMQDGDLITYPGGGATGSNLGIGDSAGDNVFCGFDYADSGVIRRGGLGLYAQTDDSSVRCQLTADAGLAPDGTGRIAEVKGDSANDGHTGGFQFRHDDDNSYVSVRANVGQSEPLLLLRDEGGNVIALVSQVDGAVFTPATIGATPLTVKAIAGQLAVLAQFVTPTDDTLMSVDPDTAALSQFSALNAYALSVFLGYDGVDTTRLDLLGVRDPGRSALRVNNVDESVGDRQAGLASYVATDDDAKSVSTEFTSLVSDDGTAAVEETDADQFFTGVFSFDDVAARRVALVLCDDFTRLRLQARPGQSSPLLWLQDDSANSVARVLPSGAIGTSAGEPADADIAQGEMMVYRVPTLGDPVAGLKFRDENDAYWIAEIPMTLVP